MLKVKDERKDDEIRVTFKTDQNVETAVVSLLTSFRHLATAEENKTGFLLLSYLIVKDFF